MKKKLERLAVEQTKTQGELFRRSSPRSEKMERSILNWRKKK